KIGRPPFLGSALAEENPIRRSLALTSRAWGADLDLRLRFPRPVYFHARPAKPPEGMTARKDAPVPKQAAEFLRPQARCWNHDDPQNATRYEPPSDKDPSRGTLDEKRFGAFPIGVAVEAELPSKWASYAGAPNKARVAVIGDGHVFTDAK